MKIDELLRAETITLDLVATDKVSAIKELIQLLAKQGIVSDTEELLIAVLKREAQMPTGIGLGIAIPHARTVAVNESAVAFGRSQEGVVFSPDHPSGAHLIFLIVVPLETDDEHLRILAHISRKLVHEEVRERLRTATSSQEIIDTFR